MVISASAQENKNPDQADTLDVSKRSGTMPDVAGSISGINEETPGQ